MPAKFVVNEGAECAVTLIRKLTSNKIGVGRALPFARLPEIDCLLEKATAAALRTLLESVLRALDCPQSVVVGSALAQLRERAVIHLRLFHHPASRKPAPSWLAGSCRLCSFPRMVAFLVTKMNPVVKQFAETTTAFLRMAF